MRQLQLDYIALEDLGDWIASVTTGVGARQVLGLASFGNRAIDDAALPAKLRGRIWPQVTLPVLGHATAAWVEAWTLPLEAPPVEHGIQGEVAYARSGELSFAWLAAPLTTLDAELATTTQQAYAQLFDALRELGCPHPLRLWNYLPDILGAAQGEERYRLFNAGRQEAFAAQATCLSEHPPAACALGLPEGHTGPLTVYALASASEAQAIENPRQVSAYRYPAQYGLRRPAFSRAAVGRVGPQASLLISGTASIVGHETVHAGDVRAQTEETLNNIASLLAQTAAQMGHHWQRPELSYKVYLRHATDLPVVRDVIAQRLGTEPTCLYLHAVVCRPDLLVEIEAACAGSR
jgi:chorismate lyase/3-hydroxybenzoate synthase